MYWDTADRPAGHVLHRLADALDRRRKIQRRSRPLDGLSDLDDHALRDIGVERHEAEGAARLPLSADAAVALHKKSLGRGNRRM